MMQVRTSVGARPIAPENNNLAYAGRGTIDETTRMSSSDVQDP